MQILGFYLVVFLASIELAWFNGFRLLDAKKPRVLLLSLGGFGNDYIEKYGLKNLARFKFESNLAKTLRPQFPTQSLPNQWSLITGLPVEDHGIIADNFYDPDLNRTFNKAENSEELNLWSRSEPLWVDTVKNGLSTFNINWPGSKSQFNEKLNNQQLYQTVNGSLSFKEKVDFAVDFLANKNFSFVLFNHQEAEVAARKFGIAGAQFEQAIKNLDESFEYLISSLVKFNLYDSDEFNLIVVGDHGFVDVHKSIVLDDFFNETDAEIWSRTDSVFHLKPLKGTVELLSRLEQIKQVTVFTREELPDSYGLKNSDRVGEVVLVADEGIQMIFMGNRQMKNFSVVREYDNKQRKALLKSEADKAG